MADKPTYAQLQTIPEFCAEYGIGRTTAYEELKAGRLRAVKCGRRTLIPREASEEWRRSLPAYESKNAA